LIKALEGTAWAGPAFALASALLFGASTPFAKLLLGHGADPWLLAGMLYTGSGLGLGLFWLLRPRHQDAPLRKSDLPLLALVVFFGGAVGPLLLMLGLAQTSASSASLLLNLEGLATMAIAWIVFRENVDRRLLLGALAILAGAVLLAWSGGPLAVRWGALAIAGACLAWGIDNNLTRKLSLSDPVQIAAIKGVVAGAVNLTLAFAQGAVLPPLPLVAAAGLLGLAGYGVSLVFFVLALRHLGSARTGAYYSSAPFAGAILAVLIFDDAVTLRLLLAGALMVIGLYLHLVEKHAHEHFHQEMTHEHRHSHDAHHRHGHQLGDPPGEPHSHPHQHPPLRHSHRHFPDTHHDHDH